MRSIICELIVVQMLYNRPGNHESKRLFGIQVGGSVNIFVRKRRRV